MRNWPIVPLTTNQACFAILPSDRVLPEYLQLWLRDSYGALRLLSEARGGNQSNLNAAMLGAFEVPIVSLAKQKNIASRVKAAIDQAEAMERAVERQVEEIRVLQSRLLGDVFGNA